jgi:acylphosphatase
MTPTETGDVARVHVWVTGRVQGVGFRAFVQHSGGFFGLAGWVRNVGYDQVETVAEGPRSGLLRFVEVVSHGPGASKVDEARTEWEPATGEFRGFGIKYSI